MKFSFWNFTTWTFVSPFKPENSVKNWFRIFTFIIQKQEKPLKNLTSSPNQPPHIWNYYQFHISPSSFPLCHHKQKTFNFWLGKWKMFARVKRKILLFPLASFSRANISLNALTCSSFGEAKNREKPPKLSSVEFCSRKR